MNINASIVDQQLSGIITSYSDRLPTGDENKLKSEAFVLLTISTDLDISLENALELITEGGNDAGVDGLHISDVEDGEFLVTLYQGKYKVKDLGGTANFPETGVQKAVNTLQILFDPMRHVVLNERIRPKIEEIRSLIRDAFIPTVRIILCNNGEKWNQQGQTWIDEAKKDFGDKVEFVHFNHDNIVKIQQKTKKVDASLTLSGQVIVEDMNYMRVLIGRVSVHEIKQLFNQHGDQLLQRNIRRYLGLHNNRVNKAIHRTLTSPDQADKFYFFNNGITVVCDKFDYNAFQKSDYKIQLKNLQIINGGQTCKTIQETLNDISLELTGDTSYVMIRIYQLAEGQNDFIQDITFATNSQNPVDLRDLRSNDTLQKQLEIGIKDLGYTYRRQRDDSSTGSTTLLSTVVAESVCAIWNEKPHHAKFRRKEHFGTLYNDIFKNLNAAQAILAVLIFRFVDNERKKNSTAAQYIPYATHYIAMLIGRTLLKSADISLSSDISHRNFSLLQQSFQNNAITYYSGAIQTINTALTHLYGDREISLQQLAATFRRGDLLEMLPASS